MTTHHSHLSIEHKKNNHQTYSNPIFSLPKPLNIIHYSRSLHDLIKKSNFMLNSKGSYIKIGIRVPLGWIKKGEDAK